MSLAQRRADTAARAALAARGVLPDRTASTPRVYWGYSWQWDEYCCQSLDEMLLNVDPDTYGAIYIEQYERDLAAETGPDEATA